MRNLARLFVALCVVLLSMPYRAEARQLVTMRGRIGFSGDPSPEVRIQLRGTGQPAVEQYSRNGTFEFPHVTPGPYEISFQAMGYDSSTETIAIRGNEEFMFQLRPLSPPASTETRSVLDYQVPRSARKELDAANKQREKSNCAGAIVHLRKALEIFDRYAEAHTEMGRCHADMGEWKDAEHEFKRSLELHPSMIATLNLADVYLSEDRGEDAEDLLKGSIDPFLQQHRERELLQQLRLYVNQARPGAFSDRIRSLLQSP
jgi:hypothetical protein